MSVVEAGIKNFLEELPKDPDAAFNWTAESLLQEIELAKTWGLWENSTLCAIACFRSQPEAYELTLCMTLQSKRSQKLMGSLLKRAIAALVDEKNAKIWLEVHENHIVAQKLYESLGFRAVGFRPKYYKDGGKALLLEYLA